MFLAVAVVAFSDVVGSLNADASARVVSAVGGMAPATALAVT